MALNQLLVVMDGLDSPPLGRRILTNMTNTLLDALYVVPPKWRGRSLRLPPPRPRPEQIYFIGATNVPISQLDPALTRPGRMGRHVWFRTPTKHDREDIFELYLGRVAHAAELDGPARRDELARMTMGYSPAMIEQVCSMALTIAHHSGREAFGWDDLVEAMTTVESGTAINVEYVPEETRAVAIHEAGPRRRRARVPEGRRVDPAVDSQPRRLARPSHGDAEGRAVLVVAQRGDGAADLGARRDGGRARLLRRELDRRRRRRPGRHRSRRLDGRCVRDGARVRRAALRRRVRGRGPRARDEALPAHRHADRQPHRRRPDGGGGAARSEPARRWSSSCSARRTWRRTT